MAMIPFYHHHHHHNIPSQEFNKVFLLAKFQVRVRPEPHVHEGPDARALRQPVPQPVRLPAQLHGRHRHPRLQPLRAPPLLLLHHQGRHQGFLFKMKICLLASKSPNCFLFVCLGNLVSFFLSFFVPPIGLLLPVFCPLPSHAESDK